MSSSTINKLKKTPRSRKPAEMPLEEWQAALRREFGREQKFRLKKPETVEKLINLLSTAFRK